MIRKRKKAVKWIATTAEERVFSLPEALLRCAFSVVAMNICVFTTLFMMDGIWPGIVLGGTGFLWVFLEIVFCALGFELLLPFLNQLQKGSHQRLRRAAVAGIALAGCLWISLQYFRLHRDNLVQGWLTLIGKYISVYHLHFKTGGTIPAGDPEQVSLVLTALICLLIFLLWDLAFLFGQKYIWILLPFSIWMAEMFVGVTPGWKAIIWFWVGLFFIDNISEMVGFVGKPMNNPRGRKEYARSKLMRSVLALGVLTLVFLTVSLLGGTPTERLVERAPQFREFEKNLELKLQSLGEGGIDLEGLFGRKKLRSKHDDYSGKVILELTVNQKPSSNIYLKSFQSGEYADGGWSLSDNRFEKACKADGIDRRALQRLLAGYGYEKENATLVSKYEIVYKSSVGTKAFLPYFADIADLADSKLSGDVLITKNMLTRKQKINASVRSIVGDSFAPRYYQGTPEEEALWDWYGNYVQEHYTSPSEDIPTAGTLAKRMIKTNFIGMEQINEERLRLAKQTANLLSSYEYSLDMGTVPTDRDLVEYFLSEGGKGFCVHFATAGVQILRQLGVPARYCEGYIAKQVSFQKTDGVYVSEVTDETEHAWVEIYLEHIGWVPVEMTPGYRTDSEEEREQNSASLLPIENKELETTGNSEESVEESKEESIEESSEASSEASSEESTDSSAEESLDEIAGSSTQETEQTVVSNGEDLQVIKIAELPHEHEDEEPVKTLTAITLLKWGVSTLAGLLFVAVPGVFLARFVKHKIREYEEKIPRAMKRGRYKTAVLLANRRLYKRLQREGILQKQAPTDREYLEALKQRYCSYPEVRWEQYMEIVRQAAFSDEPLTKEQAEECFTMYLEICNTGKEDVPSKV